MRVQACLLAGVSALAASQLLAAGGAAQAAAAKPVPVEVRVNQVGYSSDGDKVAFAMLPTAVSSVSYTVSGAGGVAFTGQARRDLGSWNSRYHAVY